MTGILGNGALVSKLGSSIWSRSVNDISERWSLMAECAAADPADVDIGKAGDKAPLATDD